MPPAAKTARAASPGARDGHRLPDSAGSGLDALSSRLYFHTFHVSNQNRPAAAVGTVRPYRLGPATNKYREAIAENSVA